MSTLLTHNYYLNFSNVNCNISFNQHSQHKKFITYLMKLRSIEEDVVDDIKLQLFNSKYVLIEQNKCLNI